MDIKKAKRIGKTFFIILIGHTLLCDVGSFVLGRFTNVDTWIALILVVFAAILVTCLLEKPWKSECKDPSIMDERGKDDEVL